MPNINISPILPSDTKSGSSRPLNPAILNLFWFDVPENLQPALSGIGMIFTSAGLYSGRVRGLGALEVLGCQGVFKRRGLLSGKGRYVLRFRAGALLGHQSWDATWACEHNCGTTCLNSGKTPISSRASEAEAENGLSVRHKSPAAVRNAGRCLLLNWQNTGLLEA